ncbi:hypothetical protein [Candidatus Protochlamydia sp. R18]|uniref:hypothetical protein n=1 Tax=Candidatus Protochlamydia sp. R18 TaxID=1353977 RepID=UPI0011DCB0E0|nr:hypothetical protein [Candidatus Protochlamydia sp. R18]
MFAINEKNIGGDFWQTISYFEFENDIVDQFLNENIVVGEKVYLKVDQIHLGTKQIFLNFKEKLLPIHSLLTDVYKGYTSYERALRDSWIRLIQTAVTKIIIR